MAAARLALGLLGAVPLCTLGVPAWSHTAVTKDGEGPGNAALESEAWQPPQRIVGASLHHHNASELQDSSQRDSGITEVGGFDEELGGPADIIVEKQDPHRVVYCQPPVGSSVAFFCGGMIIGICVTIMALASNRTKKSECIPTTNADENLADQEDSEEDVKSTTASAHLEAEAAAQRSEQLVVQEREAPELALPQEPAPAPAAPAPRALARQQSSADHSMESIHLFWPRLGVLMALMLVQSLSSLIIHGFHFMLVVDPAIAFFLTMIVGTGGNMGSQSVVLAVRKYATGQPVLLGSEMFTAVRMSMLLAPLAFLRCWCQSSDFSVSLILGVSTVVIILAAAWLGTATPMVLADNHIDPAHATPIIQVLMDILGIFVVCVCASVLQPLVHGSRAAHAQ